MDDRMKNESAKDFLDRFIMDYKYKVENFLYGNKDILNSLYDRYCDGPKKGSTMNIKCINLFETDVVFEEYIDGMCKFFDDLSNVDTDDKEAVDSLGKKREDAFKNNEYFLSKLFDGEYDNRPKCMTFKSDISNNSEDNDIVVGCVCVGTVLDIITSIASISTDEILKKFDVYYNKPETGLYTYECKEFMLNAITGYYDRLIGVTNHMLELVGDYDCPKDKTVLI